jgi:hypothetical protein
VQKSVNQAVLRAKVGDVAGRLFRVVQFLDRQEVDFAAPLFDTTGDAIGQFPIAGGQHDQACRQAIDRGHGRLLDDRRLAPRAGILGRGRSGRLDRGDRLDRRRAVAERGDFLDRRLDRLENLHGFFRVLVERGAGGRGLRRTRHGALDGVDDGADCPRTAEGFHERGGRVGQFGQHGTAEGADDLHALDRVDAQVGFEVRVGPKHVGRVAGALADEVNEEALEFVGVEGLFGRKRGGEGFGLGWGWGGHCFAASRDNGLDGAGAAQGFHQRGGRLG